MYILCKESIVTASYTSAALAVAYCGSELLAGDYTKASYGFALGVVALSVSTVVQQIFLPNDPLGLGVGRRHGPVAAIPVAEAPRNRDFMAQIAAARHYDPDQVVPELVSFRALSKAAPSPQNPSSVPAPSPVSPNPASSSPASSYDVTSNPWYADYDIRATHLQVGYNGIRIKLSDRQQVAVETYPGDGVLLSDGGIVLGSTQYDYVDENQRRLCQHYALQEIRIRRSPFSRINQSSIQPSLVGLIPPPVQQNPNLVPPPPLPEGSRFVRVKPAAVVSPPSNDSVSPSGNPAQPPSVPNSRWGRVSDVHPDQGVVSPPSNASVPPSGNPAQPPSVPNSRWGRVSDVLPNQGVVPSQPNDSVPPSVNPAQPRGEPETVVNASSEREKEEGEP